jgi:hypothetical protein
VGGERPAHDAEAYAGPCAVAATSKKATNFDARERALARPIDASARPIASDRARIAHDRIANRFFNPGLSRAAG